MTHPVTRVTPVTHEPVPGAERFWLARWEQECCGDPLVVGGCVEIAAVAGADGADAFGDVAQAVRRSLTWHGPEPQEMPYFVGTVTGILAARQEQRHGAGHAPEPGGVTRPVGRTLLDDTWGGAALAGWFVDVFPTPR